MHTRKEIDNILDNIIELIAKQKDFKWRASKGNVD